MDKATLIGFLVGFISIIISILLGGPLTTFWDLPSVFIVGGGTMASLMINFSMKEVTSVMKVVKNVFFEKEESLVKIIDLLVSLAEKARREGILAIEKALEQIDDDFLKSGLRMAVDGSEPSVIKDSMEIEMDNMESRHKKGQKIVDATATYGPAYGMIGTLIGLVNMLKTLDDPSKIGGGMAVALITTFYGACIANLICLPLKGKLESNSAKEMTKKSLIIEGVIGIQGGDNPRMLRTKLETYLAPIERSRDDNK